MESEPKLPRLRLRAMMQPQQQQQQKQKINSTNNVWNNSNSNGVTLQRPLHPNTEMGKIRGAKSVDLDLSGLEPMTPVGQMFSQPKINCYIMVIMKMEPFLQSQAQKMKAYMGQSLARLPKFQSRVRIDQRGNMFWEPVKVNLDEHVLILSQDEVPSPEKFAEQLATAPALDPQKPLWQVYLVESGYSIIRVHHSFGDGISLMSLLLAHTRKATDPEQLPEIPRSSASSMIKNAASSVAGNSSRSPLLHSFVSWFWVVFLLFLYTVADFVHMVATFFWLRDDDSPLKGSAGCEFSPIKIIYANFSLADCKIVKDAINGVSRASPGFCWTINDVLLGITSAGLRKYLERKYDAEQAKNRKRPPIQTLLQKLCIRSAILVNVRQTPGMHDAWKMLDPSNPNYKTEAKKWGNKLGYMILPFPMAKHKNNLDYAREANKLTTKRKLSLAPLISHLAGWIIVKLFGVKTMANLAYRMICNTTFSFSNIVGPTEEVQFCGHVIQEFIPTVLGHPHALTIHVQSYAGKMTMVVKVATSVIDDPEVILQECLDALSEMKQEALCFNKST